LKITSFKDVTLCSLFTGISEVTVVSNNGVDFHISRPTHLLHYMALCRKDINMHSHSCVNLTSHYTTCSGSETKRINKAHLTLFKLFPHFVFICSERDFANRLSGSSSTTWQKSLKA